MLRFNIQDKEGLYLTLLNPRTKSTDIDALLATLEDDWKKEVKTKVDKRTLEQVTHSGGRMPLPAPLETIDFKFSSNGVYYSGEANLQCVGGSSRAFESVSREGLNSLNRLEGAVPMSAGSLIVKGTVPLFGARSVYPYLSIFFGKEGTRKRDLRNQEQFEADLTLFLDIVATAVNGCYKVTTPDITYEAF